MTICLCPVFFCCCCFLLVGSIRNRWKWTWIGQMKDLALESLVRLVFKLLNRSLNKLKRKEKEASWAPWIWLKASLKRPFGGKFKIGLKYKVNKTKRKKRKKKNTCAPSRMNFEKLRSMVKFECFGWFTWTRWAKHVKIWVQRYAQFKYGLSMMKKRKRKANGQTSEGKWTKMQKVGNRTLIKRVQIELNDKPNESIRMKLRLRTHSDRPFALVKLATHCLVSLNSNFHICCNLRFWKVNEKANETRRRPNERSSRE